MFIARLSSKFNQKSYPVGTYWAELLAYKVQIGPCTRDFVETWTILSKLIPISRQRKVKVDDSTYRNRLNTGTNSEAIPDKVVFEYQLWRFWSIHPFNPMGRVPFDLLAALAAICGRYNDPLWWWGCGYIKRHLHMMHWHSSTKGTVITHPNPSWCFDQLKTLNRVRYRYPQSLG